MYERLKRLYQEGRASEAMLKNAVKRGWITDEEMQEIIASKKEQRFQCLHRNPDNTCRRTYEPCTKSCRYFGTCGECVAYFIPAGQQPCRSCSKLNAGGR